MRLLSLPQSARAFVLLSSLLPTLSAERLIQSTALEDCQDNSTFSASLFDITFTPDNRSLSLNVVGDSSTEGNVILKVEAAAYGYTFLHETINPCNTTQLSSLCPLSNLQINFDTIYSNISSDFIGKIPGIAYAIPDVDATVTVYMAKTESPNVNLACVRSRLSNGKTVYQPGVGWATAAICMVGLLASAVVSGFGHLNAGTHLAVYSLSLFTYFQSVAIVGLCAVPLPSITQSWVQDFAWTVGIINIGFLQTLATWYLRGTGGSPSTLLETLGTKSVQVLKRNLAARSTANNVPLGEYIVKGIKRMAFRAKIEPTNVFLTSIIFFFIFLIFTIIVATIFKAFCDLIIRARWMKNERFQAYREHYPVMLKGIILRASLIGLPLLSIMCLWEFTQVDSAAEVVLAVFLFFGILATLLWSAFQVIQIARRSQHLHKTPAYMLYTNATTLSKFGFLYIQFRASEYYYIIPTFVYILVKAMFVAFSQANGTVQAIALMVIEAIALVSASVIRPWMDKPTNVINIAICVVNFLNTVLLLIFTGIFNGPGLLIGVSGVVFFVLNAVFALVLLLVVLAATAFSFFKKDPETRYATIVDNRASFIKSQTSMTNELSALGLAARGGSDGYLEKYDPDESTHELQDAGHRQRHSMHSGYQNSYSGSETPPLGGPTPPPYGSGPKSLTSGISSQTGSQKSVRVDSPWQRGAGYDR